MWTRSSKDHSFSKSCKSITRCIHQYKESDKSHILAANIPTWIDILVGQLTNESKIRLKRDKPVNSKDIIPQKKKIQRKFVTLEATIKMTDRFKIKKSIAPKKAQIIQKVPEEAHIKQEAPKEVHIE